MGFEGLLGNQRLKENLTGSLRRGRISHFYLISGPEGSGKHTLARLLAASILCQDQQNPCLQCNHCRKVLADTHPDFVTVTDPEHKNIAVKIVRDIRDDMFIRPNEGSHKLYLFAQDLGVEGQNALLKVLEEPPAYGVFIIMTDNPEKLLPTVRSRCTELSLQPLPEATMKTWLTREFPQAEPETVAAAIARSGGYLGQAITLLSEGDALPPQTESFVRSFRDRNSLELLQTLVPMEKWKRDQLIPILSGWIQLLEEALACRAGMPVVSPLARELSTGRSSGELMNALRNLQKALEYAQGNVSTAAICGWLAWVLR